MTTQNAATLAAGLNDLAQQLSRQVPEAAKTVMRDSAAELDSSFYQSQVLSVGDTAPDFSLPGVNGEPFTLYEALEDGPVVLSFYRGGWCPYCNLELRTLQAALPEIEARGARLVAISPESPDGSLDTQQKNELEFAVLSDAGNGAARRFGLVFRLPDELVATYRDLGIDLEASNGDASHELPVPATFVIGGDRVIRYAFAKTDYRRRAEPSDVIEAIG